MFFDNNADSFANFILSTNYTTLIDPNLKVHQEPNDSDEDKDKNSSKKKKRGGEKRGEGLEREFIRYGDRIVYEYYDDPNELCDRLKLLISSKQAGNTNHSHEINNIIQELREAKIIE